MIIDKQLLSEPPPASFLQLGLEWYAPHPALSHWIQCYWVVKSPNPIRSALTENLYPDGGTTLVLDFSANALPEMSFNAFFQMSHIRFSGKVDKLGIRFQPGGAFQLLGLEMPLITNMEASADDLNLQDYKNLSEQLATKVTTSDRIAQINDWFLHRAIAINSRQLQIYNTLQLIKQNRLSIEDVMAHIPLSRRQLERKFQLEVGIAPARVKQLQQVKQARLLISRNPDMPLIQVALETGFYDQAHFIRQFQKITGQTPGQYRQKKMSQKYNPK